MNTTAFEEFETIKADSLTAVSGGFLPFPPIPPYPGPDLDPYSGIGALAGLAVAVGAGAGALSDY